MRSSQKIGMGTAGVVLFAVTFWRVVVSKKDQDANAKWKLVRRRNAQVRIDRQVLESQRVQARLREARQGREGKNG